MLAMSNFGLPGGPGDDPFGDDNPFKGMPIFGDLAKLFQQQGPVNWDAARQLALSIATGDTTSGEPNVDPLERIKIEQLARVADLQVANATGLSTSVTGRGRHASCPSPARSGPSRRSTPTGRCSRSWPGRCTRTSRVMPDEAPSAADPLAWMAPLMQMIGPTMLGMTAGSMVGHLAQRSFGQYDLPDPPPAGRRAHRRHGQPRRVRRGVEPPGRRPPALGLPPRDRHPRRAGRPPRAGRARQPARAPTSTGFETDPGSLERQLGEVDMTDPGDMAGLQQMFGDPETLLGAIQSPAQRELLPGSRRWSR